MCPFNVSVLVSPTNKNLLLFLSSFSLFSSVTSSLRLPNPLLPTPSREQFNNVAGELLSVCNSNVDKVLGALEGLATTSLVTMPHVVAQLLSATNLSGALTIS